MIEKQNKKKKTNSKRNEVKVLRARLGGIKSQREVAEETGVPKSSVDRIDKKLGQIGAKIPDIQEICRNDFQILKLTQIETVRRLQNASDESFIDIIRAGAESTKRYSLFMGNVTDKRGGMKTTLSDEHKKILDDVL